LSKPGKTDQEVKEISPVGSYDTKGSRLTCVYMAQGRKGVAITTSATNGNVNGQSAGMAQEDGSDEDEEDEEDEEVDIYEQGDDAASEEDADGDDLEVEFEDEEEEEDEEEMEEE